MVPGESERVGASSFFKALYHGVGAGYIEIRPTPDSGGEPPHPKFFSWPKELDAAVAHCEAANGKLHVYFGVGLRRMARRPKDNKDFKLGGKENIGCVTAAFADFDFKDVPEAELRGMLAAFPHRPSIVVKSGHGIHVYWLLDYPAMGEHLDALQLVNLGLLTRFRAQRGPQDYSRILRVPGTLNIKAKYEGEKPVTEVTYFHPEKRYTLAQLNETLKDDIKKALEKTGDKKAFSSLSRPAGGGANPGISHQTHPSGTPVPPPAINHPTSTPLTKDLTPELTQKLSELLTGIWIDGHRHSLAMYVSGILAHSGYTLDCALRLIRVVCTLAGDTGEIADRERVAADTYAKHVAGKPVAGGPALQALVESFPGIIRERALKICDVVRKSLPKNERAAFDDRGADFEILKVVKFDSRPARWCVTIKKNGDEREHQVTCETEALVKFERFQTYAFEQTHVMLQEMKLPRWKAMIGSITPEVREAPPEASPEGAIKSALEEFLEESRENPEVGMLKSFPGYDESSTYFRVEALKRFLKERGYKFEDQVIFDSIRHLGWTSGLKRMGDKVQRLWVKAAVGAAPKNGNGKHVEPPPVTSTAPVAEADDLVFPGFEGVGP